MINKQRVLTVLLLILLLPCLAVGQYRRSRAVSTNRFDNYHFLSVSLAGGYGSLDENITGAVTTGSIAAQTSLGYEFRRAGFWINVSGQLAMWNAETKFEQFTTAKRGADSEGDQATFFYTIDQTDNHRWYTVGVPIILGYYVSGFYFGFGAKVAFNMYSTTNSKGTYELSAQYDDYEGIFRNMPERGYTTYHFDQSQKVKLNPHGYLLGEVGYDLLSNVSTNSEVCNMLKIAFYFEYGLNSVLNDVKIPSRIIIDQTNATRAQVNPYFTSALSSRDRVAPYFLGVKLTYLFGGSNTGRTGTWHRGCQCYGH